MKTNSALFSTFLAASFMTAATANAQFRFGIKGDVGLNTPKFSKDIIEVENLNSFKIGPTFEFDIRPVALAIEGSILYGNDRMNVKDLSAGEGNNPKQKISNHYIDVPLNLKYKIGLILPVKVYLAAGPYARFRVAGDDFILEELKNQVKAKSFEAGINLGLGTEVFSRVALGLNYGIIMTDNYSADKPELKDVFNSKKETWSITASIYF